MMLSAHAGKLKENGEKRGCLLYILLTSSGRGIRLLMNKTREEFYSKFIEDNGTDQRKLFCAAKKLLGASDVLNFPVHLDKTACK